MLDVPLPSSSQPEMQGELDSPSSPSKNRSSRASWELANEAVRDLHRAMGPPPTHTAIHASLTLDGLSLPSQQRLHPDLPSASELKQPGGFRRAHLIHTPVPQQQTPHSYARTSLLTLLRTAGPHDFITTASYTLDDGTQVRFESRHFRRGRAPEILKQVTGEAPSKQKLRFCGFQPTSVPYWVSLCFFVGGLLFTVGSFLWMIPQVGGAKAPAWEAALTVSYPFFAGSIFFLAGCYLAFVEMINANLQEELAHATPAEALQRERGSGKQKRLQGEEEPPRPFYPLEEEESEPALKGSSNKGNGPCCCCSIRWWGWQPHSVLFWAAWTQLFGAVAFEVSCVAGLPGVIEGHTQELFLLYIPSIIGSLCFTIASRIYVAEVTHSFDVWLPEKLTFGFWVAMTGLIGSVLFLIASLFQLVAREPWEEIEPWEFYVSEWGVRFVYGLGSAFFVVGGFLGYLETLN